MLNRQNNNNDKSLETIYNHNKNKSLTYISLKQKNINENFDMMSKSNSGVKIPVSLILDHNSSTTRPIKPEKINNSNNIYFTPYFNRIRSINNTNNPLIQVIDEQLISTSVTKLPRIKQFGYSKVQIIEDLSLLPSIKELQSDIIFQSKGEILKLTSDLGRRRKNLNSFRRLMQSRIENAEYKQFKLLLHQSKNEDRDFENEIQMLRNEILLQKNREQSKKIRAKKNNKHQFDLYQVIV